MIAEALSALMPRNSLENPALSLTDPNAWESLGHSSESDAGILVNPDKALSLAPVWQAVSLISGDVATATPDVYRRTKDDDREVALDHPAEFLICDQWNDETIAFEGWRRLMLHALLFGNGYAYIVRRSRYGIPLELVNLLPDRTCPRRHESGELYYVTEVDGRLEPLFKEEVLHVKGLSLESGIGLDLVCKARNSWGLALAAEGFASKFFANGAQAGGILEIPVTMTDQAKTNLEEGWAKKYTGKDNWFKTAILRDGAKFHEVTIDAERSQMGELREHQVRDVARFYNLPPAKLGLQDSVSYNSAEQSQIQYITGCLTHWFGAVSGEMELKLLTLAERKAAHYIEHNVTKLIEVDTKTLNEVLAIQRQNEVINANEWRRKINLPKRTDPGGDEYVNPNTKSAAEPKPAASDEQDGEVQDALKNMLRASVNRIARRVSFDAKSAAKKSAKFQQWIEGRAHDHRAVFDEVMMESLPVIAALQKQDANALCCGLGGRFFQRILSDLTPLLDRPAGELQASAEAVCDRFESEIADQLSAVVFPVKG